MENFLNELMKYLGVMIGGVISFFSIFILRIYDNHKLKEQEKKNLYADLIASKELLVDTYIYKIRNNIDLSYLQKLVVLENRLNYKDIFSFSVKSLESKAKNYDEISSKQNELYSLLAKLEFHFKDKESVTKVIKQILVSRDTLIIIPNFDDTSSIKEMQIKYQEEIRKLDGEIKTKIRDKLDELAIEIEKII